MSIKKIPDVCMCGARATFKEDEEGIVRCTQCCVAVASIPTLLWLAQSYARVSQRRSRR